MLWTSSKKFLEASASKAHENWILRSQGSRAPIPLDENGGEKHVVQKGAETRAEGDVQGDLR